MPNLLVDIDFLEKLAAAVDQLVARAEQSHRASQSSFVFLESDWQGQFRQNFDEVYTDFLTANERLVREGQELSQQIRQAISRFEQIEGGSSVFSG